MSEPNLDVTTVRRLPEDVIDIFWPIYRASFEPLTVRAAARHLLSREEFEEDMRDERILKFLVQDGGRIVGMTTMTTDLDAVPWISPEYYRHHYPEHAARGAIYYFGYALVDPDHRRNRVFVAMLDTMLALLLENRAIAAYDVSRYNDETVKLAERLFIRARQTSDVTVDVADVQTYYAATFHGPRSD